MQIFILVAFHLMNISSVRADEIVPAQKLWTQNYTDFFSVPDAACKAIWDFWIPHYNSNQVVGSCGLAVEYVQAGVRRDNLPLGNFANCYVDTINRSRASATSSCQAYTTPAGAVGNVSLVNRCPINSTLTNAYDFLSPCRCNVGFVASDGICVLPDLPSCGRSIDGAITPNPILPATGEKVKKDTDYIDNAPHALNFSRYYRGQRALSSSLGAKWSHQYANAVLFISPVQVEIHIGNGNVRTFRNPTQVVPGQLAGPGPTTYPINPWFSSTGHGELTPQSGGLLAPYTAWHYKNPDDDSLWIFDAAGKALSQTLKNGWTNTHRYDAAGQLIGVTNTFNRSLVFAYSVAGQLTSVTTPDSRVISYGYDSTSRLTSVSYPDGTSKSYLYENAALPQALTGLVDEAGQRSAYEYDTYGRATSSALPGGMELYQVSYGAYTAQTAPTPPTVVTDPLGTARAYNYSTNKGKLAVTAADKPSGSGGSDAASRIQDANGFVTQETDFLGVQTMYTWDINRRLPLSTTQAAGRPEEQTASTQWHPTFRLPILVTEAGKSTAYTYDTQGNKISEIITDIATGQARTWAWTYNAAGLVATSTDPKGGITTYAYNPQGLATSMTNPLGHVSTYTYDAAGRQATQLEPNGLASSYLYDARGRLLSSTTGSGAALETTAYTYHPTGQLATAVLPSGYSAAYTYDAAQRLVAAVDNRGNRIDYTLDAMGNRLREEVKDPGGNIALLTRRVVNQLNRVSNLQGANNQTTAMGFDLNGDAISQTDPLNQTTRQTLDGLRRPVATAFADNASTAQTYNQLDQLTQVTDPKGVATTYTRNVFGEVVTEASADVGSISYTRNAAGEVVGSVDAKGNTTSITRDALGRPLTVTRTHPASTTSHVVNYTYDSGSTGAQIGYLAAMQDPSGSTSYQRDSFGRVVVKTQTVNDNLAAPSSYTTRYTYGTGPNKGELASITYPSGLKAIYNRSASGQIIGISTQLPGLNKPVVPFVSGISYTALNQPKAWTWASGDAAARTFDADGRMTSNEFAAYTFDAASRITGITQNLWASRTVTQVIGTATTVVTQLYQAPLTWQAAYDNRNRLTGFNRAGSASGFTYDANSNRLTALDQTISDTNASGGFEVADTALTTNQTLNLQSGSNRLLGFAQTLTKVQGTKTLSTTNSTVNYALDANGNLLSDGLRSFEYDTSNRLSKVRILKDGEAASIKYLTNALGQQVFKSEPKPDQYLPSQSELGVGFIAWLKTNFGWLYAQAQTNASLGSAYVYADGPLPSWAVLGEYDNGSASGAGRTEYIWLPTEDGSAVPVGMFRNGRFFAIHTDHLGTPRQVTDSTNRAVWQWPYSAFGNNKPTGILKPTTSATGALTNQPVLLATQTPAAILDLRFPGQMADEETGLFYNYFRNYQPNQGRYTQTDPIGLAGGLNRMGYVGGNAISRTDPLGLQAQAAAVVCGPFALGCAAVITGAMAMSTPQGQQIVKDLSNKIVDLCKPGDDDPCDIVLDKGQLKSAGIRGREHEVKEDALGSNKNLSKFDLCGCKNGRVVVKFHGCRGPVIEVTDYKWK